MEARTFRSAHAILRSHAVVLARARNVKLVKP
jgi:hypothetical protein